MSLKQVIIMRKDLNMRKGKMVAQGCHASVDVVTGFEREWDADYGWAQVPHGEDYQQWLNNGQTKICVSVNSEQELIQVFSQAQEAKLPCSIVRDKGLTEFKEPTYTCCAIGPAQAEEIDKITGALPLL